MELKIGDRIYTTYGAKICSISTVERMTKTMAITKNGNRFKVSNTDFGKLNLGQLVRINLITEE